MGDMVWDACFERLALETGSDSFNAWIRPLQARREEGRLLLLAPNRYVAQRVEKDFIHRIAELVAELDGQVDRGGVVVQVGSLQRTPGRPLAAPRHASPAEPARIPTAGFSDQVQPLDPDCVFDTFIDGPENDLVKAAAIQVSKNPGKENNPLLFYGGVGLGKTHLMQAIGHAILRDNPRARIIYIRSEIFTNHMVDGLRTGTVREVMERYRNVDALLIDDVHFFAKKLTTQENFFHVFNAVLERRRPIVLTSDRYPREIDGLEARLQSRFVGGLTQELVQPEVETRVAILQKMAEVKGVEIPYDAAFVIAELIDSNVRELKGALSIVVSRAQHYDLPVTVDLARDALANLFAMASRRISLDRIVDAVVGYYNVRAVDLKSRSRVRTIVRPRQMAMALAKELTNKSLPEIGAHFGGRDHSTVVHAVKKIAELRATQRDAEDDFRKLRRILSQYA